MCLNRQTTLPIAGKGDERNEKLNMKKNVHYSENSKIVVFASIS